MAPIEELVGTSANLTFEVTATDTAEALLSGNVPVLATPRLIAWVEAATVAALADWMPLGLTSVGTRVDVAHTTASPVGAYVAVRATILAGSARLVEFRVEASHWAGTSEPKSVLAGRVTRAIVDRDRFVAGVISM